MRILLINTNREHHPYPVMPIGLACVAQALEGQGHEVSTLDLAWARNPGRAIAQAVRRSRPGLIGLSIRNLDNSSLAAPRSYLSELRAAARVCRQESAVPLVIGGAAVGVAPHALCAYLGADYAVAGEGEETAPWLARALEEGRPPAGRVLGVGEGSIAPASGASLVRYLDVGRYLRAGAPLPLQTRRGCAFHCAYCTYPAIEGSVYRLREPAEVADDCLRLERETGRHAFEFVDSTFNVPLPYALELCRVLSWGPRRLHLQASGFTPAAPAGELLPAMVRAGFDSLVCSPDSAADSVLELMGKGFGRQELERLVDEVHRLDLSTLWSFLFGGPGESEETVRDTLGFITRRLGPQDRVFIAAGVRIYPGTPLEALAQRQGMIAPGEDMLPLRFYLSPLLSLPRLGALLDEYLGGMRNCVYISDLQHSLLPWLQRAASALGIHAPLWRFTPALRRLAPHRYTGTRRNS